MNVAGMPGIPRPESFRRTELATAREEAPPVGMTVTNFGTIQMVDIKCQTSVVTGFRAVRRTCKSSDPKTIALLGQGFDCPQHLPIQFYVSSRSGPVRTPACHLPPRRLFDVVARRGTIVSTAHLPGHPVNIGTPL